MEPAEVDLRQYFDDTDRLRSDLEVAVADCVESVQGIYAILDARSGQLYVGKADGSDRISAVGLRTPKTDMVAPSH